MKKTIKYPEDMTATELAKATAEFDRPFAFEKARPMTPARRTAGTRPAPPPRSSRRKTTHESKKISISLKTDVLRDADALARKKGVKRSELIAHPSSSPD